MKLFICFRAACVLAVCVILPGPNWCEAQSPNRSGVDLGSPMHDDSLQDNAAYMADRQHVMNLDQANDIAGLESFAAQIQQKYSTSIDPYPEYRLLLSIADDLVSRAQLSNDYLARVKFAGNLSLEVLRDDSASLDTAAMALQVNRVALSYEDHGSDHWPVDRAEFAQAGVKILQRFDQAIKPGFDPTVQIFVNNVGMAPSPDPAVNAQRQKLREEHEERSRAQEAQLELYRAREQFKPDLVTYLGWAYSKAPANNAELLGYLKTYNVDADLQSQILAEVTKDSAK